jgi:subtilisin-like proprotein convertase family protein
MSKGMRALLAICVCLLGNPFESNAGNTDVRFSLLACDAPFALNANTLSDTSVSLFWTSSNTPQETEWQLEIIPLNANFTGNPTHLNINSNPVTIQPLSSGSQFRYKVRAVCAGTPGPWSSEAYSFYTAITNSEDCNLDLPIPDAGCPIPNEIPIQITTAPGTSLGPDVILDEVRLIIEHEWLIDLEGFLRSPSGKLVQLFDENGGTNDDFGEPSDTTCQNYMTLLNAVACGEVSIDEAGPPFSGRYLPLGNLNHFNDGSSPLGLWTLLVCDDALENTGTVKFVELVFKSVNCTAPTELEVEEVDSTTVILSWTPGNDCNQTIIEYGNPGFIPGTGTQIIATCPPFEVTGLTGGSFYEFYVLEDCGNNTFSNYSCNSVEIKTKCSPPPASIHDHFNDLTRCLVALCNQSCPVETDYWFNAKNEDQDWAVNQGNTFTSFTGPADDVTGGGKYLFVESSSPTMFGCAQGSEAALVSNCFDIQTNMTDSCHMSFFYHMYGRDVGSLRLEITLDGLNWDTIWTKSGDQGNVWYQELLPLDVYVNNTAQFRFIASRGNGNFGDIALDEIAFFGTSLQGQPGFTFYADADEDGFGDEEVLIKSCFQNIPEGYIDNDLDCNDSNPDINLAGQEIPCNGLDENCNGMADDFFLPPPGLSDTTICEGTTVALFAEVNYGGDVVWYNENGVFIHYGNPIVLSGLTSNGDAPATYKFYAEEVSGFCYSSSTAEAEITVLPLPSISTDEQPVICQAVSFDLNQVNIVDANNTAGTISYHTGIPADSSNQIFSEKVYLQNATTIFIKSTANGGCTDTTSVLIDVIESPQVNITNAGDTLFLCKGESAFLTAFASGGLPGYDAYWQNFDRNTTIRVDADPASGTFFPVFFTAIDQNNCPGADTVIIATTAGVEDVQLTINDVTICNGRDGSITIEPLTGEAPFRYIWSGPISGSQNNQAGIYTINGLEQGSYDVTIFDGAQDCEFVLTNILVNGPSAKVTLESISHVDCHGGSNGAIDLTVTGNNPTITWSNGLMTEDLSGLTAGTYSVTVSDGPCMSSLEDLEVIEPDVLTGFPLKKDVTCNGFNNGTIEVMVTGGNGNFQITWNDAGVGFNRAALSPGSYAFTIIDNKNCSFISNPIVISEPQVLELTTSLINATCSDRANGGILAQVSGGSGSYTYNWSNQSTRPNQNNLLSGTYDLTVTDSKGCFILEDDLIVSSPPPLGIRLDSLLNASCFGVDDAGIYLTPEGGVSPYNFDWNNNSQDEDLTNLPEGEFQVTITDANNCTFISDTFEVLAPSLLNVQFNVTPPICIGRTDGRIITNIQSGGSGPFNFNWDRGDIAQNLLNVGAGFYSLTITDANGCVDHFDSIRVVGTQVLNDDNLIANNPVCHDQMNGLIFSNILGGVQPYFYDWSNNAQTQDVQNLSPGTYQLTVSDSRGCKLVTDTIIIENPDPIEVDIISMEPVRCFGENSGTISVEARGGEAPYTYSWNNNFYQGSYISNLQAGNYQVSVQDGLGCLYQAPIINLPEPAELELDIQVISSNSCQLTSTEDSIMVIPSGGVFPYQYLWSTQDTINFLSNIPAGEYDVTVTDENGCQKSVADIKMPEFNGSFQIDEFTKTDVSCFGANDGFISISFMGGTPPYQYLWSDGGGDNGGTTMDEVIEANNLQAGRYELTVVDATGCVLYSGKININQPENMALSLVNMSDVSCFGGGDGKINVRVTGGNYPYTFQWLNANRDQVTSLQNPIGLPKGTYSLIVRDYRDCVDSISNLHLDEPDSFFIRTAMVNDVLCKGDSTGSIVLTVAGGTPQYNYTWSNQVNDRVITNLGKGNYTVTIEDDNRCVLIKSYQVNEPVDSLSAIISELNNPKCTDESNGTVLIDVSGGSAPFSFVVNGVGVDSNFIQNLSSGSYEVFISDSNSCNTFLNFELENPEPLEVNFTVRHATQGIWNDGSATVNVSGGTPPYTYLWENMDTTQTITELTPGWYLVVVKDSFGCTKEGAIEISTMTSTKETPAWAEKLLLSPIPAKDQIILSGLPFQKEDYRLEIYSSDGSLVKSSFAGSGGLQSLQLDVDFLSEGMYWLLVRYGHEYKALKFTKI